MECTGPAVPGTCPGTPSERHKNTTYRCPLRKHGPARPSQNMSIHDLLCVHVCSYVFSVHNGWAMEWDPDRAAWTTTLDTIDAETVGNVSRCHIEAEP